MKRLAMVLALSMGVAALTPVAQAALRFVVIDGTNGKILSTDLAAGDLKVTRNSTGFYTLTFKFNVLAFMGSAQMGGPGADATRLLFTSTFDTKNSKHIDVAIFGVAAKSPVLDFTDGRITILVNK